MVPRIPEFSPDSRLLSFEARMLMLPCVCNNFLSKRNGLCWSYKGNSQICRKVFHGNRLEIINKIEAKRASNATREHTTLVGVGLRWCDDGDEVIPSLTVSAFSREPKTCVVHATSLDRIMLDVLGKAENIALVSFHQEHNFCSFWGDVMFD